MIEFVGWAAALVVAVVVYRLVILSEWANAVRRGWRRLRPTRRAMPRWKRRLVWTVAAGRCTYCKGRVTYRWQRLPDSLEVDHRVPWSWGGSDSVFNLTAACREDNQRKGARIST